MKKLIATLLFMVALAVQAQFTLIVDNNGIVLAPPWANTNVFFQGNLTFNRTNYGGLIVNNLTTAQRLAVAPSNGMIVFDSTTGGLEAYYNSQWNALGSGGGSGVSVAPGLGLTAGTNSGVVTVNANYISPPNYGCVGDGKTVDTTAWNATIAALNSATTAVATLDLLGRTNLITSTNTITRTNVTIQNGTILFSNTTGICLQQNCLAGGFKLINVQILQVGGTPSTTCAAVSLGDGNGFYGKDAEVGFCIFTNFYRGIIINGTTQWHIHNDRMFNIASNMIYLAYNGGVGSDMGEIDLNDFNEGDGPWPNPATNSQNEWIMQCDGGNLGVYMHNNNFGDVKGLIYCPSNSPGIIFTESNDRFENVQNNGTATGTNYCPYTLWNSQVHMIGSGIAPGFGSSNYLAEIGLYSDANHNLQLSEDTFWNLNKASFDMWAASIVDNTYVPHVYGNPGVSYGNLSFETFHTNWGDAGVQYPIQTWGNTPIVQYGSNITRIHAEDWTEAANAYLDIEGVYFNYSTGGLGIDFTHYGGIVTFTHNQINAYDIEGRGGSGLFHIYGAAGNGWDMYSSGTTTADLEGVSGLMTAIAPFQMNGPVWFTNNGSGYGGTFSNGSVTLFLGSTAATYGGNGWTNYGTGGNAGLTYAWQNIFGSLGNMGVSGEFYANDATITNKITNSSLSTLSLVMSDANKALESVTLGTGLSFSGTTLNATGGGSTPTFGAQFNSLGGNTNIVSGVLLTNINATGITNNGNQTNNGSLTVIGITNNGTLNVSGNTFVGSVTVTNTSTNQGGISVTGGTITNASLTASTVTGVDANKGEISYPAGNGITYSGNQIGIASGAQLTNAVLTTPTATNLISTNGTFTSISTVPSLAVVATTSPIGVSGVVFAVSNYNSGTSIFQVESNGTVLAGGQNLAQISSGTVGNIAYFSTATRVGNTGVAYTNYAVFMDSTQTSITNTNTAKAVWDMTIQFNYSTTGTPAVRLRRTGIFTNTYIVNAGTNGSSQLGWDKPVAGLYTNYIDDVSTGSGASITVIDSHIEQ